MSFTIVPFFSRYTQDVIALISHIQQNEYEVDITPEQQPDLQNISGFYQIQKGNFWIALDEDKVIGTIAILDIGDNQGALRKMFVDREYRGKDKAVAEKLLQVLLRWAQNNEIKTIFLGTTPQFQAAHRFYEKNLFQEISSNELPPNFPILEVDKKFYKYDL